METTETPSVPSVPKTIDTSCPVHRRDRLETPVSMVTVPGLADFGAVPRKTLGVHEIIAMDIDIGPPLKFVPSDLDCFYRIYDFISIKKAVSTMKLSTERQHASTRQRPLPLAFPGRLWRDVTRLILWRVAMSNAGTSIRKTAPLIRLKSTPSRRGIDHPAKAQKVAKAMASASKKTGSFAYAKKRS